MPSSAFPNSLIVLQPNDLNPRPNHLPARYSDVYGPQDQQQRNVIGREYGWHVARRVSKKTCNPTAGLPFAFRSDPAEIGSDLFCPFRWGVYAAGFLQPLKPVRRNTSALQFSSSGAKSQAANGFIQFLPGFLAAATLPPGCPTHLFPPSGELGQVFPGPTEPVQQIPVRLLLGQLLLEILQGEVGLLSGEFQVRVVAARLVRSLRRNDVLTLVGTTTGSWVARTVGVGRPGTLALLLTTAGLIRIARLSV